MATMKAMQGDNELSTALLRLVLRAKHGAKPSGQHWVDPNERAWASVNRRRADSIRTERQANLALARS